MNKAILRCSKGFTLIEIIVTIVIAAIAASMMVTFMGKNITSSSVPVTWVKNQGEVNQAMEKIVVQYKTLIDPDTALDLGTFQTWIAGQYPTTGSLVATFAWVTPVPNGTATDNCPYGTPGTGSCTLSVTLTKDHMSVTGLFTD